MDQTPNQTIMKFSAGADVAWEPIDDRIMGGCSKSHPEIIDDVGLRFSGIVSLENDGGFASIRSATSHYDLSNYDGVKLRIRGDGKTYKISLRTDDYYDGVSYQTTFSTEKNSWQEISLLFEEFIPTHHGKILTTVAPLDTSKVRTFGFFIADRQEGPFQLDIAWIKGF